MIKSTKINREKVDWWLAQPMETKIEAHLIGISPDSDIPEELAGQLKPYRVVRKQLATFCLFVVLTTIILGMQV